MRQIYPFILIALFSVAARAAGHEGHEEGLTPHVIKTIMYQTLNVVVLFAGLIYFLRQPAKTFFSEKRKAFLASAERAQAAREQAEKERMDIQVRLGKLESTAEESISRARAEAAEMKAGLLREARILSEKIQREAEIAARLESEKAKAGLRSQMIQEAAEQAQAQLSQKVTAEEQARLQGQFINNIQSVHS